MSRSTLIHLAGIAAIISGALYITIQFIHPVETLAAVSTPSWLLVATMTFAMAALGTLGVTGLYVRQAEESGTLGFIGFVLLYLWLIIIMGVTFAEGFILPPLVDEAPEFVESFIVYTSGDSSAIDSVALEVVALLAGIPYILGGLIFGIATLRAKLLSRWGAILLIVGTLASFIVPLLPHSLGRMMAIPVGLALILLGYSLRAEKKEGLSVAS